MENYTIADLKAFLKGKGYVWSGKVWLNGAPKDNVEITELYGRTKPIILFALNKNGEEVLQYASVFDTSLKFWQEGSAGYSAMLETKNISSHFTLQEDFSKEWADFLAARHNHLTV